jgi:hypothetical protein
VLHGHQPLNQQTKQGSYPKSLNENVLTQQGKCNLLNPCHFANQDEAYHTQPNRTNKG